MPMREDIIFKHGNPETCFRTGISCVENGDYADAEICFRQTLLLAPESLETILNLGYVLDKQGRSEEAFNCYESVLKASPTNAKARYNRAIHLLRAGNLTAGFADYEARFAAMNNADNRLYSQPRWDGLPLNGKSILVYCEQGLGDAIQFSRYIPFVARLGGRVILEVQQPLLALLSTLPGVDGVVLKSDTPPIADCHIPLLSLPGMFNTIIDSVPSQVPYLLPDSSKAAFWRKKLETESRLRVGLVWSGSSSNPMDRERSCPLFELDPLLSVAGVSYYSVQVGPASAELASFPQASRLANLSAYLDDFSDTAALIANLDLIITVDTAVAHLAGALGKPAWVLLAYCPDWRWMLEREDSPWYPSIRLIRQPSPGAWPAVVRKVIQMLQEKLTVQPQEAAFSPEMQEKNFLSALALLDENETDAAISALECLAYQLPYEPAVWFNLGRAFTMKGQFNQSEHCYRQALLQDPGSPAIWYGLGGSCLKQNKYAEAEKCLGRAHELKPESIDILLNLGSALVLLDRAPEAFDCCRKILAINPDCAEAVYNLAFLQLRSGDYQSGFANFEARFRMKNQKADTREYFQPRWDGSALNGRTILVYGEQGMGDVIQFARYIPLVAERGGEVVFEVDPPLLPLFEGFPGVARLVAKSLTPPLTDLYIQTLSLPYIFGTTIETVPNRMPYIVPDVETVARWQKLLASDIKHRVGLVWRGNPLNPRDKQRSCQLSAFQSLADLPNVTFYCLQVGLSAEEADAPPAGMDLVNYSGQLTDFAETAALIANLDLVISVDTAVAHLAGAMGRPVWVLLPEDRDWRWLQGRSDTPWYSSMRLYGQTRQNGWEGVLLRVRTDLERWLAEEFDCAEQVDVESEYEKGALLKELGDFAAAEYCFRRIVGQHPDLPDPQHSLGVVLQLQGRLQEAIIHYRNAIDHDPGFAKAHYNLANALLQLGLYQEATFAIRSAIEFDPAHADAHWLLGMLLLQNGDFQEGWNEYEWRWKAQGFTSKIPDLGRPQWDGTPLAGKTLLIHMEQGRGDMIQFIRYASLAAGMNGKIVACVLPELVTLLSSVGGLSLVVDRNGPLPAFDVHIPVQSLPNVFGTTLETVPASVPYLHPVQVSVAAWAAKLAADRQGFRIGLVWSGNEVPNANRSCPLGNFAPLLEMPGTVFYSLQIGKQENHSLVPEFRGRLLDHTTEIKNFADTAALMFNLDLIICIDTASAHLAGALGKPVWTLLPFVSDWRWLLARDDSPWYPTMRLFRQTAPGNWSAVVYRLQQELASILPGDAPHKLTGIKLLKAGRVVEAERALALAVADNAADAEAYCNLGVALDAQGRYAEAVSCYQDALSIKPDFMQAFFNLGNAWLSLGKQENARLCYEHVIELSSDFVPAYLCLGEIEKKWHEYSKARTYYERSLLTDPANADSLQGLAEICQAEERYQEAIEIYEKILSLEPGRVSATNMLGTAYQCLERLDEASDCYRQALLAAPENPTILNNLGVVLTSQGYLDEAVAVYRQLLQIDPDYGEGHWNYSVALLASGAYQEGWREFEWRFRKPNPVPVRKFSQPRWDGKALEGKTVLLHAEQGFGDTIQFVRYVPLVASRGGKVIVECQVAALKQLLLSVDGVADVVVAGEVLPNFDCHLPLMSLPYLFGTDLETIPGIVPYLTAPADKVDAWRQRLGISKKMRVGLVWFAKQSQVLNRKRSCPLRMFAPLWSVPNVEFYTLQIGVGTDQLEDFSSDFNITDLTSLIDDFADTAAFMANLDLVISIDTAVAHLAGALGVNTWVVLPHVAEWRWLSGRDDSPWYPSMRLFRQPSVGDWGALMGSVADTLQVESGLCSMNSNNVTTGQLRSVVGTGSPERLHKTKYVGLAWSGRQDNPLNRKRSCEFTALAPLFDLPGIRYVKLQLDVPNLNSQNDPRMIDLTDQIRNFEDTAALMANLDLIVSIDTSVAHLAAATGRPTWVLLSNVADWRWSADRNSSPWYPEAKLFRQPDHGDWDSVVRELAHCLALSSDDGPDWEPGREPAKNIGSCSGERQELESLLESRRKDLFYNGDCPDTNLNFGATLALLGRHGEAIAAFRRVLELEPGHVAGHLNLAYSLLSLGEYREGWQHFEWRLQRLNPGQLPPWPMLDRIELGRRRTGASLLVHCEQGFGDTIQFIRFLPMLAAAGYQVTVSCQPPLAGLVASTEGVSQVVSHGAPLPKCDLQVLLLSLPWLFDSNPEALPVNIPYVKPRSQLVNDWKIKLYGNKDSYQKNS